MNNDDAAKSSFDGNNARLSASSPQNDANFGALRRKILGLGERSLKKSYYPELRERLRQLEEAAESYRAIFNGVNDAIFIHDADTGGVVDVNERAVEMYGLPREAIISGGVGAISLGEPPYDSAHALEKLRLSQDDGPQIFEWQGRRGDGSIFWVEVSSHLANVAGERRILVIVRDIDARKRAEAERKALHQQLEHSQKLESIGRLAGGVAHDFNNMLCVILGHTEIAMGKLDPAHPVVQDMLEIQRAGEHSASLARQLLMFARRQNVAPRVINLNEAVADAIGMLRRLIGEDIDLAWLPGEDLWRINIDPTQVDQTLANLCVNARDAIAGAGGGKITIGTANVVLDEWSRQSHAELVPGDYVTLSFADNGQGMDGETLERIFEPFFTTKDVGKGTGLGLATIYGIVKQNSGGINVYSEPGNGTIFKIYLPRCRDEDSGAKEKCESAERKSGGGTILLVEDEPSILVVTSRMLESLGYQVVKAGSPEDALRQAEKRRDDIDLLVSDVVMPGMNGRELAEKISTTQPRTKVLFMSGYTADTIASDGVLENNIHFIQKPFTINQLAEAVAAALDI